MTTPGERYEKRVNVYLKKLDQYTAISNKLGNLKLITFFAGVVVMVFLLYFSQFILLSAQILLFAGTFIYLAVLQDKVLKKKAYCNAMQQINSMCAKRVEGKWPSFPDKGEEFEDPGHRFSYDLDLFGKDSLFQMINMTSTHSGRSMLARMLIKPLDSRGEIILRQEAVAELAGKQTFRQKLLSHALLDTKNISLMGENETGKKKKILADTLLDPEDVYSWAEERNPLYSSAKFKVLITGLPVLSLALLGLSVIGIVPAVLPVAGYILQFLMLGYRANFRNKSFEIVEKYLKVLKVYSAILEQLEKEIFKSSYIKQLKLGLVNNKKQTASEQIKQLSKLWDQIANRYNFFHIVVNTATLWDFHCLVRLEDWKKISGSSVKKWFEVISEAEALSSMSIMVHDNPGYTMPVICEGANDGIIASELGHPLLRSERKCNDITINTQNPILLITGSNMSGKSTFLRTVGLNLMLAYVGMPVCAAQFKCPMLKIYACMRTSDNLGQSVSSFYAELLRVKMVVEAVDRNERVFFLLDEIFKGTNSADRHMGARILINQLDKKGAWGMVSTHDLELADLEENSKGRIRNYHFKEYYKDNRIFFDYKLRKGVSDTRNAIYLMKMAGVDFS